MLEVQRALLPGDLVMRDFSRYCPRVTQKLIRTAMILVHFILMVVEHAHICLFAKRSLNLNNT